jgi:hypothetical protein
MTIKSMTGGVARVAELLFCKGEVLSSNPSPTKQITIKSIRILLRNGGGRAIVFIRRH